MNSYFQRFIELKRLAQFDLPNKNYQRNRWYLYIQYILLLVLCINLMVGWFNVGYVLVVSNAVVASFTWLGLTAAIYYLILKPEHRIFALFGIFSILPVLLNTKYVTTITTNKEFIADWLRIFGINF